MLATGSSMELSYQAMLTKGHPAEIHVASIIASQQAIEHIKNIFPEDKTIIWCAAIDPEINEHSYIGVLSVTNWTCRTFLYRSRIG